MHEFEILYKRNHPILCKKVYLLLRDKDAASDIVQNVFYKYWINRRTIVIHSSPDAYLFTACVNEARNFLRNSRRRLDFNQQWAHTVELSINNTDDLTNYRETNHKIQKAIECMPPGCQKVFLLSRYDEMNHDQIAQHLNISINTVNNHIKKALDIIRRHILLVAILLTA